MAVQGRDMGVQGVGLGVQGAVLLLLCITCRADEFTRSLDSEGYLDIFQVPGPQLKPDRVAPLISS